ncbi:Cof-type HAD-IIB family hydrolase [Halalkalibacter kiskunsagensis]|uniref:Cof-type HAD-IIB family hydrolase n=1 Tax=Halalkalibacter kiskunsagensis TaxID=1548599 RepID=A0ABV6KA65_9BACI
MIKLIAIDMDGTLLGDIRKVTTDNAKAIKEAQNQGIEVVVATGRDEKEARLPVKEANITCPIISVNGAQSRDEKGNILSSFPINKEQANVIFDILRTNEIYFEVYTNRGTVSNNYEKALQTVVDFLLSSGSDDDMETMREIAKERFEVGAITLVDSYHNFLEQEDTIVLKVLAFSKDDQKRNLTRKKLLDIDQLAISASARDNIEITSIHAQKGLAVKAYAQKLGISMNDVMVIGDSFNDISMFEVAGVRVAMENAEQEVKELADFVTNSNEEDGVAFAIRSALAENK